jgi:hypothetical protein
MNKGRNLNRVKLKWESLARNKSDLDSTESVKRTLGLKDTAHRNNQGVKRCTVSHNSAINSSSSSWFVWKRTHYSHYPTFFLTGLHSKPCNSNVNFVSIFIPQMKDTFIYTNPPSLLLSGIKSLTDGLMNIVNYSYCHVAQWLRRGFRLVIGFIGYLQVVTTNNYYTISDFHTTEHSTLLSSVYLL